MHEMLIYPLLSASAELSPAVAEAIEFFATYTSEDETSSAQNNRLLTAIRTGDVTPNLMMRFCEHRLVDQINLVFLPGLSLYQVRYGKPPRIVEFEIPYIQQA